MYFKNTNCAMEKETLYKDCKSMFEKYQDAFMKKNISDVLVKRLKTDIFKLESDIEELKESNNKLLSKQNLLEDLLDSIGIIDYDDIYNFIFGLYDFKNNHISMSLSDDVEDYITNYNLSLYNKKEKTNIPYFEQIKNKCKYSKYTPMFVNINKDDRIIDFNKVKKIVSEEKIIKNTMFYNCKIYINKLPIIIVHNNYLNSQNTDNKIVKYFDINKYFINLLYIINKYNLSFDKNKNTEKKKKKTIKKEYQKQNPDDNINYIINTLSKKNKKSKTYNIRLAKNKAVIKMYSDLLQFNGHLNEKEINELYTDDCINDTNESRLFLKADIYNKIYNNKIIYNSDNIINIGLIDKVRKSNIDMFINKLEEFCKNGNTENTNIKKNTDNIINDNSFNYNYILENKKAFLFNEENNLYTYNLYEEKIIADRPEGLYCYYCGFTRYNASPCVFRNCKNRKYGDFEFRKYKDINKKEMESIYNINYVNNKIVTDSENNTENDESDLDY